MFQLGYIIRNIFHTFRKFKLASTLNLAGLCIALMSFFLFFTKIEESVRYNTCFPDWNKIFRVEISGQIFSEDSICIANVPIIFRSFIQENKHVKDYGILQAWDSPITFVKNNGGKTERAQYCYVNGHADHLNIFGISYICHEKKYNEDDVIVPSSFAMFQFGTTEVLGKYISWETNGQAFRKKIAGVYRDFPKNCCVTNSIYRCGDYSDIYDYFNYNYNFYIRVDDTDNIKKIEDDLSEKYFRNVVIPTLTDSSNVSHKTQVHLRDVHMSYFSGVDEISDKGNMTIIVILFFSSLLILSLTNVNSMNYTLAMAPIRIKSINTHRVLGASRHFLILSQVFESILTGLGAFLLSVAGLFILNSIIPGDVSPISHVRITIYTLLVCVAISVISSSYPAYYSTSFEPSLALKGTFDLTRLSKRLRNLRIGFQILICAIALTTTISILLQIQYVFSSKYGYTNNQIIYGTMNSIEALNRSSEIKNAIEDIDGVESVAFSQFKIGTTDRYMLWSKKTLDGKHNLFTSVFPVDCNYISTMGIEITEGRNFNATDYGGYIFNEAARKKYPWLKVGGHMLPYDNEDEEQYKIVGFCQNIIFSSVRNNKDEDALVFLLSGPEEADDPFFGGGLNTINIKTSDDADIDHVRSEIRRKYKELVPEEKEELKLTFLTDHLKDLYEEEIRFFSHMILIASIYICITLIGVFCITMFESEYKRKEICIRKIFGASNREILTMFNRKYMITIAACYLLAIPVSWIIIDRMFAPYYMISPYLWIAYPVSFVTLSILVLGVVTIQCWKSATQVPVQNLKNQ